MKLCAFLGIAAGAVLPALVGCSRLDAGDSFRDKGLRRVAFELECPQDQIRYSVLDRGSAGYGGGCVGATVGVIGCGKKAVYVCAPHETWVNNTGRREAEAKQPPL